MTVAHDVALILSITFGNRRRLIRMYVIVVFVHCVILQLCEKYYKRFYMVHQQRRYPILNWKNALVRDEMAVSHFTCYKIIHHMH